MRTIAGVDSLSQSELEAVREKRLGVPRWRTSEMARNNSADLPAHVMFGKRRFYPIPNVEKHIEAERERIVVAMA